MYTAQEFTETFTFTILCGSQVPTYVPSVEPLPVYEYTVLSKITYSFITGDTFEVVYSCDPIFDYEVVTSPELASLQYSDAE